nr:PREDICTED: swi5-dependent recombination DNA repair protein 1 homolog [Bemisia tabaci]
MTTNSEEIVTPAAIHDLSPSPEPTPPASPEIIPASDEETDHPIPPLTQLTPPNPELPSTSATPDVIPAARPKAVPLIILETSDEEEDPISREEPVPKRSRLSSDGKYHNQYNWPPVAYGQRMQETVGLCEDPNTCKLLVRVQREGDSTLDADLNLQEQLEKEKNESDEVKKKENNLNQEKNDAREKKEKKNIPIDIQGLLNEDMDIIELFCLTDKH